LHRHYANSHEKLGGSCSALTDRSDKSWMAGSH